jgi:hypothetical protein
MTSKNWLAYTAMGAVVSGAIVSLPGTPRAADTQAAWQGFAITTANTAACAGVGGSNVGDTYVSIYRPKINPSDTATFLSFIRLRSALALQNTSEATIHQMNGSGKYSGDAIDKRAKSFTYASTYSFTVAPHPVTSTTGIVKITGTFNDYYGNAGCNLTIEGTYMPLLF